MEVAPSLNALGDAMENILIRFARRFDALMHFSSFIDSNSYSEPAATMRAITANQDFIAANKAMFIEIFGEEAPQWWGQFDPMKCLVRH